MKLKVAAWNMGHWMHRGVAQQAWNYIDREIARRHFTRAGVSAAN